MPKTSLGIQRTPGEAIAVRLQRKWKRKVVDQVVRLDLTPGPVGETPSPSGTALPSADTVVAALPSHQVFRRDVEVPFTDPRKVVQAAPLEAEESLPIPLENLVCDVHVLERGESRSRALAVAAPIEKVSQLLSDLKHLDVEPTVVDVEALALANAAQLSLTARTTGLLVDLSPHLSQCVLLEAGRPTSFHAFSARGATADLLEELALYLSLWPRAEGPEAVYLSGPEALVADLEAWSETLGRPVRQLPFPEGVQVGPSVQMSWPAWAIPFGLALRGSGWKVPSQLNFLRGPLAPARGLLAPRTLAITAGAYAVGLVALWAGGTWAEISFKEAQHRALQAAIRDTLRATVPEASGSGREVDQMRSRVSELEERDRTLARLADRELSPLKILKDLSAKMPKDLDVEFRELAIEGDKVRIEGATTSYEASERIKAAIMASSARFVDAASEARDGTKPGEILFKLTITVGEKA
jgi:general secretion pathway protein L